MRQLSEPDEACAAKIAAVNWITLEEARAILRRLDQPEGPDGLRVTLSTVHTVRSFALVMRGDEEVGRVVLPSQLRS